MTSNNNSRKNTSKKTKIDKTPLYYDDSYLPDQKYQNKLPYVRSKSAERNERLGDYKEKPIKDHTKREVKKNRSNSPDVNVYHLKDKLDDKKINEADGVTVKRYASLICRTINHDGEPVTVNNEVITNKLILSCHPRDFYTVGRTDRRPVVIEAGFPTKYVPVSQSQYVTSTPQSVEAGPQTQYVSAIPRTKYINAVPQAQYINPVPHIQYDNAAPHAHYIDQLPQTADARDPLSGRPIRLDKKEVIKTPLEYQPADRYPKTITRSDRDITTDTDIAKAERLALEEQNERYETKYKSVQCKRYTRNFRTFLWALFFINLLLILVGLALLLLTLSHLLFRGYISSVILHSGFVMWLWAVLALATAIVTFALFGIITAITRNRSMLRTYCVVAAILALIILIYLLLFWVKVNSIKGLLRHSMSTSFSLYRCQGWARRAWDDLQDRHECCGVDFRTDWKYIPTSCCQADTTAQKLGCVGHFINMDQAYRYGCRSLLEAYFLNIFLLITCLLILAFTLLILGIIAAYRLSRMYKIMMLCRETYYISP